MDGSEQVVGVTRVRRHALARNSDDEGIVFEDVDRVGYVAIVRCVELGCSFRFAVVTDSAEGASEQARSDCALRLHRKLGHEVLNGCVEVDSVFLVEQQEPKTGEGFGDAGDLEARLVGNRHLMFEIRETGVDGQGDFAAVVDRRLHSDETIRRLR